VSPLDSLHEGRLRRIADRTTPAALGALLSVLAGVLVFLVATDLFPYHSANHDEAVYLQQAHLLLDGRLWFTTDHPAAFRPWFFVRDGARLYPKYSPVPAAVFALGVAVDVPRLALALVAVANAGLLAWLASAAFDARTGALAVVSLAASPLFVFTSSVFLPYAPTAMFDLAFAVCYIQAHRQGSRRYAALAGTAIGIAFFARPYTAVVFATPFICHALWSLARALRGGSNTHVRAAIARYAAVALPGLAFVALALAYNHVVTGAALRFPYAAFAPLDGLGFGRRRILGRVVDYTPTLALRANAHVLYEFATRWTAFGPLGTALAGIGIAATVGRTAVGWLRDRVRGDASAGPSDRSIADDRPALPDGRATLPDRHVRWLLVGVLVAVAVGNVAFWGNLNVLGTLSDPTDGLIAGFGPYYHFDALAPLSVFGAAGALWLFRGVASIARTRLSARGVRAVVLALLLVAAPVLAVAEQNAVGPPLDEHRAYTERYERAYDPFESRDFDRALVFVPTPYGDWLAHPFQSLYNQPGFAGDRVYALDRGGGNLAVFDSFPNRTPYRYTYRGEWQPDAMATGRIVPHLQRLQVRSGTSHRITTTVGVPNGSDTASVRLVADGGAVQRTVGGQFNGTLAVEWQVTPDGTRILGAGSRGFDGTTTVSIGDELALVVTFVQPGGATVTYRYEIVTSVDDGRARLLWPPETEVCRLTTDCGHEGTYVPSADDYLPGVSANATIETSNRTADRTTDRSVDLPGFSPFVPDSDQRT